MHSLLSHLHSLPSRSVRLSAMPRDVLDYPKVSTWCQPIAQLMIAQSKFIELLWEDDQEVKETKARTSYTWVLFLCLPGQIWEDISDGSSTLAEWREKWAHRPRAFCSAFERERYWFHNEHASGVVKLFLIIMIKTISGTKMVMSSLKYVWDTKFSI
jgi:hypothetical protein